MLGRREVMQTEPIWILSKVWRCYISRAWYCAVLSKWLRTVVLWEEGGDVNARVL